MLSNRSVSVNTISEIISLLTADVVREENNFIRGSKYKDAVKALSTRLHTFLGQIFISSNPSNVIDDYYQKGNIGLSGEAKHFSQSIDVLRVVVIQEILKSKDKNQVYHRWVNVLRHSNLDKNYAALISISSALSFLQRRGFEHLKLAIKEDDSGIIDAISRLLASPSAMMKEFNSEVPLIPNMPALLGVVDKLKENISGADSLEVEEAKVEVEKDLKRIKRRLMKLVTLERIKFQLQGSELSGSDEAIIGLLKTRIDSESLDEYYSTFDFKHSMKQFAADTVQASSSAPNVVERPGVPHTVVVRRAKTSGALTLRVDAKTSVAATSSSHSKGSTTSKLKMALSNEFALAEPSRAEVHTASSLPTDLNPLAMPMPARKPKPYKAKTRDKFDPDELGVSPRRSKSAVGRKPKLTSSSAEIVITIAEVQSQSASSLPTTGGVLVGNASPVKIRRPRKSSAPDKPGLPKVAKKNKNKGTLDRSASVANLKPVVPTLNLSTLGQSEASSAPQATTSLVSLPAENYPEIQESKKEATPTFPKRKRGFVAIQKAKIDNACRQEPVATSSATVSSSPRAELVRQRINALVKQAKNKEVAVRQRSNTAAYATLFAEPVVSHLRRRSSEASLTKQSPAKKK
ncbi:MAG: hypothetical protein WAW86_07150 [Gammaproteobacteria bacterium]